MGKKTTMVYILHSGYEEVDSTVVLCLSLCANHVEVAADPK